MRKLKRRPPAQIKPFELPPPLLEKWDDFRDGRISNRRADDWALFKEFCRINNIKRSTIALYSESIARDSQRSVAARIAQKSTTRNILPTIQGFSELTAMLDKDFKFGSISNEQLRTRSAQLLSLLETKNNCFDVDDVRTVLMAIRAEGIRRGPRAQLTIGANEYFNWPTVGREGSNEDSNHLLGAGEQGLLNSFGYKVGNYSSLNEHRRRMILDNIFEKKFSESEKRNGAAGWGEAKSALRLKKMALSLVLMIRMKRRIKGKDYAVAISDWTSDLNYLKQKYYIGRFGFAWPKISEK